MSKDPDDTQPRRRGRPRKPDAMTPAERMRRYRQRVKAGLVTPQTREVRRIAELESRIAELESRIAELELDNANLRKNVTVTDSVTTDSVTVTKKEIWPQSGGCCQAAKRNGDRCRCNRGLRILSVTYKDVTYDMSVCPRHYNDPSLRPASVCLG